MSLNREKRENIIILLQKFIEFRKKKLILPVAFVLLFLIFIVVSNSVIAKGCDVVTPFILNGLKLSIYNYSLNGTDKVIENEFVFSQAMALQLSEKLAPESVAFGIISDSITKLTGINFINKLEPYQCIVNINCKLVRFYEEFNDANRKCSQDESNCEYNMTKVREYIYSDRGRDSFEAECDIENIYSKYDIRSSRLKYEPISIFDITIISIILFIEGYAISCSVISIASFGYKKFEEKRIMNKVRKAKK